MKATLITLCLIATLGATAAHRGGPSDDDGDKRPLLSTVFSCNGDCRPNKFPRCTGSCVVIGGAGSTLPLSGKDFSLTLSACTGTCTDVNFPSCDGTCTANAVRIDDDGEDDDAVGPTRLPRPTLIALSCTDGCTSDTFPKCTGTCKVAGGGQSANSVEDSFGRNKWTVGPCTGACTPETFPLCDGACEVTTVASVEKGKGSIKGSSSSFNKTSNKDKKIKESKKDKGKGEKGSKGKGKGKGKGRRL